MRTTQTQAVWDPKLIKSLSGVAYGTYSYAPSCKGDLLVTVHVDLSCGNTYHFQAQGFPEQVMQTLASKFLKHFIKLSFHPN
jgi:hypothetical protein